jgi:hypothetical protein
MAQAEIESTSVVLRGNFNPVIFQPAWFASQNLVHPSEAQEAEVQIIHPDATVFQTEWLQIQVTRDRFMASTSLAPYYELLRDLVCGVFERLSHTPLNALGVNAEFHYKLSSIASWHATGHLLAPKQVWQSVLKEPGMRSLVIEGQREDQYEGRIHVKVEPSARIDAGVYIDVNDHYQLAPQPTTVTETLIEILNTNWEQSRKRSLKIAEMIVGLGEN